MKNRVIALSMLASSTLAYVACESNDDNNKQEQTVATEAQVVENYANIVLKNYQDALSDAQKLKQALYTFVDNPTEETFKAAKEAWLKSRESYGPSEAFRFAGGPIDNETGPEALINSWPLDENYIDYVQGDANAGIINNLTDYPTITKSLIKELNQPVNGQGETSEENVSTGYHAIEFLLWGQDLTAPSLNKAGLRSYVDYTPAVANYQRRGQYLKACADLLVEDLQYLVDQWKEGGPYRTEFLKLDTKKALSNMITGIAVLSKAELAGERMYVALQNQSQEDEHSCFSDNTHRDIRLNFDGIKNVYTGKYGSVDGASIEQLVRQADPAMASEMDAAIADAKAKVYATKNPFDIAVTSGEDSEEGQKVLAAVHALQHLGDKFVEAAGKIGVSASSSEEE